jgi:hypothetical protein
MHTWRTCARVLPAIVIGMGWGFGAFAEPGQKADQRLLFNPAALDQTAAPPGHDVSAPAKRAAEGAGQPRKVTVPQRSPSSIAPRYFDNRLPIHGSDRHISAVPKKPGLDGIAASPADPRFSVGTFSLGVETDTNYKPRSPFNPDASEMGYDTTYDPRHRVSVPFIGLSAKSILP